MNFINSILSENIINALGWTIIHSLWQGALVALGFASVLMFLRRYNARTRYQVGVIALMLILTMSVITFVSLNHPGTPGIPLTGGKTTEIALTAGDEIQGSVPLAAFFKNYFNRHLPLVVTLWGLGVLVLVLHLAGGYLYNQRLKVHRIQPLPETWKNRLETFCRQSGISTPLKLVESALVKVPMTIGHFKPVILFPLGMVTGLPQDQVEALLAHELAHILRKDYLVNLLQHLVDILFFYHPGVRWISTRVRAEREHCCDDIAVSLSGDSLKVAKALTNIQDYAMGTSFPALAAAGKRTGANGLLARIKRLLRPAAAAPGWSAGAICASILVVGLLTLAVSTNAAAALNTDITGGDNPGLTTPTPPTPPDEESPQEKELEKNQKEKLLQLEMKKLEMEKIELEKKYKELLEKEKEVRRLGKEPDAAEKDKLKKMETLLKDHELKLKQLQVQLLKQPANLQEVEAPTPPEEVEPQVVEAPTPPEEVEPQEEEALTEAEEEKMQEEEAGALREGEEKMAEQAAEFEKQAEELKKHEAEFKKLAEELPKGELKKQLEELKKHEAEFKKLAEELPKAELKKQLEELKKKEVEMQKQEAEKREQEVKMREEEAEMREQEVKKHEEEAEMRKQEIAMKDEETKMREDEAELHKQEAELREIDEEKQKQFELFKKELVKELLQDKLITDATDFEFQFKAGKLYINGKEQLDTVFKKYKKLLETSLGKPLDDDGQFIIVNRE